MTKEFDILNAFIGSGNPSGKIWFIGLEEANEWSENPEENNYKPYEQCIGALGPGGMEKLEETTRDKGKPFTPTFSIMSKLLLAVAKEEYPSKDAVKDYRYKKLLWASGDTFQCNLYAIGKRSLKDWPPWYKPRFGFNSPEQYYKSKCVQCRFEVIRKQWKSCPPYITICFGKGGWNRFRELLELDNEHSDNWYQIYRPQISSTTLLCPRPQISPTIFLCPFLSYRPNCLPDKRIIALSKAIREAAPDLPSMLQI